MYLSTHFTLEEMTYSDKANELGIDNSLSITNDNHIVIIRNLMHIAETVLEPARKHFGLPITPGSGFRCPILNKAVGGSPASQHMQGAAVDFEIPGVSNLNLAYWLAGNIPKFDQIILDNYDENDPFGGWVHISATIYSNRMERRTMGKTISGMGLPALLTSDI